MAFVYRTTDKQNITKPLTPGPGAYFNHRKYNNSQQLQHRAPFNHSENREIWKTTNAPGPGSYQSQNHIKKQKKLLSDIMGQIVLYQTPVQSVAFKSKTIRFGNNANSINPGPGEYDTQPIICKPVSASKKTVKSTSQLKQFLKQKNKFYNSEYQQHQNKQMIVSANDNYISSNEQTKLNEFQIKKQNKNSIFFVSKVQRNIQRIRPQTSAGPGSYNISKSTFQIQKKCNKKNPVKSICIDKKIEKVQIQEVGPGYYDVDQAFKSLNQINSVKKKKIQCFGSTVDRFQICNTDIKAISPGPAAYALVNQSKSKLKKPKSCVTSFPKEQRKIFGHQKNNISPVSYNTIDKFSLVVKQKYERKPSVKQCFGTTKERFLEQDKNQQIKNGSDCNINLFVLNDRQSLSTEYKGKQAVMYKTLLKTRQKKKRFQQSFSHSQPKLEVHQKSQRPLCYDNQTFTLSYKYGRKTQNDAPFLSGAERFKNSYQPRSIDLSLSNIKKQSNENRQSKPRLSNRVEKSKDFDRKIGWIAVNKDKRFKYEDKIKILGPQHYDPILPDKRSYNVLFA